MSDAVVCHQHEGWAELVFNRPEVKNAINGPFGLAFAEHLERLNQNDGVRAIVLRGEGGAFCSGLDLKAFNASPQPAWVADFQTIWRRAHSALFNSPKPIVGALERYAINGGAALALACDLLVVGRDSFLQVGEVQIGMGAPYNLAWLSLRHSEALMAEVALVGDRIEGPKLVEMGLAQSCVEDGQVVQEAADIAQRLGSFPSTGPINIKAGLRARLESSADDWFDRFARTNLNSAKPSSMSKGR